MTDPILIAPIVAWAGGLSVIVTLALTIWNMLTSGSRKNERQIAQNARQIADLERQMIRVNDHMAAMPSISTIHQLEIRLTQVVGELGRIDEKLKPVAAMAERSQELLLKQAKAGP